MYIKHVTFQSTRLLRASTLDAIGKGISFQISIHKALASLDQAPIIFPYIVGDFNPQSSREPRQGTVWIAVRAYDISIHKALASLDHDWPGWCPRGLYFNPQGSREPRRPSNIAPIPALTISIHKALASLDHDDRNLGSFDLDFNPQGSREPRPGTPWDWRRPSGDFNPQGSREPRLAALPMLSAMLPISIHKALASLDVSTFLIRQ